ncbi:MAG: glycosyltransferase [Alphaproteobacteria bacterium]|nr:glycosyltransferase [Alphaproteobacteria bacterium]
MKDAGERALDQSFANGNYHRVAASGRTDRWQTFAALGLCGNTAPALDGLARFDEPEARFYEAAVHWIDGNEDAAATRLEDCEGEYAARLLAMIRKRRIQILAQLPWSQFGEGPHAVLEAARTSAKFTVQNIGSRPGDLRNSADADVHTYYDRNNPPDFYLAQMIEWQLIPPNLQELPCPIIGQTADFDLHIQMVQPWLKLFDTLIVTDMTEYDDVSRLVDAPVATFPKTFSLPSSLPPPPPPGGRDIDLMLTGTTFHDFHREKAEILHQILRVPDIAPFIMNGYLDWWQYHAMLARARLSISHVRHPGASPSRGIETLGMGTVLLAQPETTMRLWVGEAEGLLTYELADNGLSDAIKRVLADFPAYEQAAQRGMAIIRNEFTRDRLGAQYLRFATFLAARPATARQHSVPPPQKRVVAWQGWLQHDGQIYSKLQENALTTLKETPPEQHTVETLSNAAREMLLDYVQQNLEKPVRRHRELVASTLEIFRIALQIRPQSLVLRFNFIRTALHFGGETDIEQALGVARETLAADTSLLELDPHDDVMTWDYCATFFNYRSYLDYVTEAFMEKADQTATLKALILASIAYYCGRITGETRYFASAAEYDPTFPAYRLAYAKSLVRANEQSTAAVALLHDLCTHSLYAAEAWSLLKVLQQEQGISIPDEAATQSAIQALETRTLLDTDYKAIRDGYYFRTQRLGLARNEGYDVIKESERPISLSVLLADVNGSRYPQLMTALKRQSLPRSNFEIIAVDVFDRISPAIQDEADTIIALGQSEYLYNRNVAFNMALSRARGQVVALFDNDAEPDEDMLARLLAFFEGGAKDAFVVVNDNAIPIDRHSLNFLSLTRARALRSGGLDESPYRAAGMGGPYELGQRLLSDYPEIQTLEGVSFVGKSARTEDIEPLLRYLQPYEFSPVRRLAKNENPEIKTLREAL